MRELPREAFPAVELPDLPDAWDSHSHLDRTAVKAKTSLRDLQKIFSYGHVGQDFQVNVTGGVAVFCDLPAYHMPDDEQFLGKQGVVVAISILPKFAPKMTKEYWKAFKQPLLSQELQP